MTYHTAEISQITCETATPSIFIHSNERDTMPIFRERIQRQKKKNKSLWRNSIVKNEKRRTDQLVQQIISAKQRVLCDQQCEIEELKRKLTTILEDNRFLRDHNQMQRHLIEKLDGKNAKLPSLVNSQIEEIRVYREQLRRMKDLFLKTNKARQDAELARQKADDELHHLRDLAISKNLPEREELVCAVSQLQEEVSERDERLKNMERYIENLEKNQRFERRRLLKNQKEIEITCDRLTETVHSLQMSLQEKQKVVDIQNMYMQRLPKTQQRVKPSAVIVETRIMGTQTISQPAKCLHTSYNNTSPATPSESQKLKISVNTKAMKDETLTDSNIIKEHETMGTNTHTLKTERHEIYKNKSNSQGRKRLTVKQEKKEAIRPRTASDSIRKIKSDNEQDRPNTSHSAIFIPALNTSNIATHSAIVQINQKHVKFTSENDNMVSLPYVQMKDDEKFELLCANERLARLVAEAKMENKNPCKEVITEVRSSSVPSVAKIYQQISVANQPLIQSKVSEPLSNIDELINARNIQIHRPISTVQASGDLPEENEVIERKVVEKDIYIPVAQPVHPPSMITQLVREIYLRESEQENNSLLPVEDIQLGIAQESASIRPNKKKLRKNFVKDLKSGGRSEQFGNKINKIRKIQNFKNKRSHINSDTRDSEYNEPPSKVLTGFLSCENSPDKLSTPSNHSLNITETKNEPYNGIGTRLASTLFSNKNNTSTGLSNIQKCEACSASSRAGLLPCILHRHNNPHSSPTNDYREKD